MADEAQQQPSGEFKPNIYPVMYWALLYGVVAGVVLWIVSILAQYITIIWFPVFLAGLIWGGFRNYKRQKEEWQASSGQTAPQRSVFEEFKEAVGDISEASQQVFDEAQQEEVEAEPELQPQSQPQPQQPEQPQPPEQAQPDTPPQQPQPPRSPRPQPGQARQSNPTDDQDQESNKQPPQS